MVSNTEDLHKIQLETMESQPTFLILLIFKMEGRSAREAKLLQALLVLNYFVLYCFVWLKNELLSLDSAVTRIVHSNFIQVLDFLLPRLEFHSPSHLLIFRFQLSQEKGNILIKFVHHQVENVRKRDE